MKKETEQLTDQQIAQVTGGGSEALYIDRPAELPGRSPSVMQGVPETRGYHPWQKENAVLTTPGLTIPELETFNKDPHLQDLNKGNL